MILYNFSIGLENVRKLQPLHCTPDIVECNYNDTKFRSSQGQKHKYTQGRGASYFPMQVCGNICGASVVVLFKCCSVQTFEVKFVVQVLCVVQVL